MEASFSQGGRAMANTEIVPVGFDELSLVVDLFNEVFRPGREQKFFERRFQGRLNPLLLIAQISHKPAGFAAGYELKPGTFYCWLVGVRASCRRAGIASQLMEAIAAWAIDNEYHTIRFECYNRHRPMLRLAISQGFDVVGVRMDPDAGENLIVLERKLGESSDSSEE